MESTGSVRASDSLLAHRVAWLHFVDHETNLAIAEKLGISRFRVAKLIDLAIDTGIVSITFNSPSETDEALSERVRRRYKLSQVLVAPAVSDSEDPRRTKQRVSQLAARYVSEVLVSGSVLGVAWGSTLDGVATAVESLGGLPTCDVVQMIGEIPTVENSLHASELLRRFKNATGGRSFPLHAPLLVPDEATARGLKSEASIARTLRKVDEIDVAILAVGSWRPPSSRLVDVMPLADVEEGHRLGVQADVCGVLLDLHGNEIVSNASRRMIATTSAQLRAIPLTVGIASGPEKIAAIKATVLSGLINTLVTDEASAQALLQ
ncbi:sugar-binding transcriptional regulator [Glaciihabitans sp. INWT7]|uniref:sugar-binding transcriptional regulator n=1 Tax=Glaciihabitans sp. INWT7 TaxID=2596912 RepID=UPI001623C3D1|nr:sugar-binding domain-containing protein [Glaciihabitans sp. INWT7]